ncbi:MAG: LysM peptidoglycan-binding domain-containing protein [Anaerolineae bacterium]|nr:LysM peptidoglycan-binding domain-containing protein [Anaerolineae bacterium]
MKIKSSVRIVAAIWQSLVLTSLLASACTRLVIYPSDLTATANASYAQSSSPTPLVLQAATTQPSYDTTRVMDVPPTSVPTPSHTPTAIFTPRPPILYNSQSGDTLQAVSVRFGVNQAEITSPDSIPQQGYINPNQLLIIPARLDETTPSEWLMPDSEIVFSSSAIDFDIEQYILEGDGYLKTYREYLDNGWNNATQIVTRVAYENSINPKILLAVIQHQGNWVFGQPRNLAETDYPAGYKYYKNKGLYRQLNWAAKMMSIGYYEWRSGNLTHLTFLDKSTKRLAPDLNAGTVALLYLFSKIMNPIDWGDTLYTAESFPKLYAQMFGDPWARAQLVEPLLPPGLTQPILELPFLPGHTWSYTGGPHHVWFRDGGPLAAIDFAPPLDHPGCSPSDEQVTAVAPGVIARSGNGIVVLDLDGDGYEQTGWSIFYLHIGSKGRAPVGKYVDLNDPIGYPSCEGGSSTGTHVHIARKYNGEWMLAEGPVPFVMSGWQVHNGDKPYLGTMTNGDQTIVARVDLQADALITRPKTASPLLDTQQNHP